MRLFDRLKKRYKNDEALKEKIQNNLEILAGMDIRANDEEFVEWLLKEWGKDRVEADQYTVLLYTLGSEREVNGIWTPLSNDIYSFDTECICDGSEYEYILRRLSEITKGEFSICNIKATVDYDNCTARLSFENNSDRYNWSPLYQEDWFDCNIITKLNQILQEQHSTKFFYNSSTDQNMNIIFSSEDTIRELNKIVSIPFELI